MLEIRLLGTFDLHQAGKSIAIPSRPAQSLFAYLVLNAGTAHRREKLAGLLWPDSLEETARDNLRHALWRLRKALSSGAMTKSNQVVDYLLTDDLTISFNASADYWLDVNELEKIGEKASADELLDALAVYHGELLPGFYDEWVILEREHLRAIFEHHMARLMSLLQIEKRWLDILDWGERWIKLGQTPEPAYRALMSAHAAKSDMSKVVAIFERCVKSLRELGIEPSEQTKELYKKLTVGQEHLDSEKTLFTREKRKGSPRTYIPVPITSFIGREREVKDVEKLVSEYRLVTLTGSGGVGKTRLAIQVADQMMPEFKDGVWWVELASITDVAFVSQAVAQLMDVHESHNQSLTESLKIFLRQKQGLLILDNCEHLITACAQLAEDLLTQCASLRILATSREALGITGEMIYQVPTLSLPESRRDNLVDRMLAFEGIRLFFERASAVKSDFLLTEQNAPAVLQICQHLDGIPLAIELAAARIKMLPAEQIAGHLNDRFNLLTQGSRTALPRQQTLRATLDWSYDLLPKHLCLLFRRLSVFAGGFTLEAAERICSEEPLRPRMLFDLLAQLVDRSLVTVVRQGEAARYHMLETISEYAREKLEGSGEMDRVRQRHCAFFVQVVERAAPRLKGAEQFEWLDRLELEHDNLRTAWDWAKEHDDGLALRLAPALLDYWLMRGSPSEGRQWLEQLLPRTILKERTSDRAHVLGVAGRLAYAQRDFAAAQWLLEDSLFDARAAGDKEEMAFALWWLGRIAVRRRDNQAAQAFTEESLLLYRSMQYQWGIAMAIYQLADLSAVQGQYALAEERYLESLAKFQNLGDKYRVGYVLNSLGELSRMQGDYQRAGKCYEEHIEILREQRSLAALVIPLVNQAWVTLKKGDHRKARILFEETLQLSNEHGNRSAMVDCLAGFASILAMNHKTEQAARMFGAVESLLESLGMAGRLDPSDQKELDFYIAVTRSQLDEVSFEKAWARGRKMGSEQAIAFALENI